MHFADISFRKKIIMLLFFPMLAFLILAITNIIGFAQKTANLESLEQQISLSVVYSNLVHELQKERGATAGFLGSKGVKFGATLKQQRLATNNKIATRKQFINANTFEQPEIVNVNSTIFQALRQLDDVRNKVDQQNIALKEALSFYTKLNADLLSISSVISQLSTDAVITNSIVSYYSFLQGKERAGIERAVLSNTFALDKFANGMYTKFTRLVSEQHTYFSNFLTFASQENKSILIDAQQSSAFSNVVQLRNIAIDNAATGQFNTDAVMWFEKATVRIKALKKIEDTLASRLKTQVTATKDEAFSSQLYCIVESIILILLSTFMSFYIIRNLNSQVSDLTYVMKKVREENDLTVRANDTGLSELGQIGLGLNLTLEAFAAAIQQISSNSQLLASSAEETSYTCEHNSDALKQQQQEIMLIATAVEQLSATYKEVASNTQNTADAAKNTDNQASDGLKAVQQSYLSIENLSDEITTLSDRISNLHESSNNITSVVDVIKAVAEQTNLLALNAAIEAARAGDQGRGFAVVADEVRTLAQRTQNSTTEIESFIHKLQADADAAYSVIESSKEKASKAVENSRSVEQNLTDITASVSEMFSMSEQIASAVEEQAMVTQDVAKNVVSVESNSMETTTGATQIAVTAKEQSGLAISLQEVASTFKV